MKYDETRKLNMYPFDAELNKNLHSRRFNRINCGGFHTDFLLEKNPTNCDDANIMLVEKSIEILREKIKKAVGLKIDDDKLELNYSTKNWIAKAERDEVYGLECLSYVDLKYNDTLMDNFSLSFHFNNEEAEDVFCCDEFCHLGLRRMGYIFVNNRDYYRQRNYSRLIKAHNILARPIKSYLREKILERKIANKTKKDNASKIKILKKEQNFAKIKESLIVF